MDLVISVEKTALVGEIGKYVTRRELTSDFRKNSIVFFGFCLINIDTKHHITIVMIIYKSRYCCAEDNFGVGNLDRSAWLGE